LKKLVVKKRDRQYIIDYHEVKILENKIIIISGYDFEGMYFQIKHEGKYEIVETEVTMIIELK
jgi:hypothetical protein